MYTKEDDMTREMLGRIRFAMQANRFDGSLLLKEEKENDGKGKTDAIAITDEPKFGTRVLSSQIETFRMQVESGAQFNEENPYKPGDSPLIFLPDTKNLVFSGTIPALNNLKWQFVLKTSTGNGCFVWADGLIVSKDNLQILNKLYGYYQNWRESWQMEAADLDRMVQNIREND